MEEYKSLKDAIDIQAEFIEKLNYKDLSEKSIGQAKLILLDSIGCMAAGNQEYSMELKENGGHVIVGKGKNDKETAVFYNGASMVKNELDEGNQFAFGHPACHIIPAFLAETEDKSVSGKEVVTALTAAYEVSCRWGGSTKIKSSMHGHGTMQTIGSAAVTCKLNHCDRNQITDSVILANSLPQSTSWNSAFHGDQIRNAYIGISNIIGMNSLPMVRAGIKSSIETLYSVWNNVLDGSIDEEGLIKNLQKEYLIEKNYFKVHAACRYTHSFADMLKRFLSQGYTAKDVKRIEVETYRAASKLKGQSVPNSFAMKFSIPVSLAVCMIYGDLSLENVTDEHVANSEVNKLASKIFVNENEDFTKQLPDVRRNKMVIWGEAGKIYEEDSPVTRGDYQNPYSSSDVTDKFIHITGNVWGSQRQKEIIDFILSLDEKKDVGGLFSLIGEDESVWR